VSRRPPDPAPTRVARARRTAAPASFDDERLDRASTTPLWSQLHGILRRRIEDGRLTPSDRLPSESELCTRFGVSRIVVRDALSQLVADGLIYKIKGKGTFVSVPRTEGEFVATTVGFREEMAAKGLRVRTRVLAQAREAASAEERARLGLEEPEEVVRLERLYTLDGTPSILVTSALPSRLVPGLERVNLEDRSLYETIRRRYGLIPFSGERSIEATLPDAHAASLLGVTRRQPVLAIESVTATEEGALFEFYRALQRTDGVRLRIAAR
jgi:GntR family transcriptional regulator